jgi:hypothetical protein
MYTMFWPATAQPFPTTADARDVSAFQAYHARLLASARNKLMDDQQRRTARTERTPAERQPFYKPGDLVRLAADHLPIPGFHDTPSKFLPRYSGPFKVLSSPSPHVYELELGDAYSGISPVFNVDRLRPYHQPSSTPRTRSQRDAPPIGSAELRVPDRVLDRKQARGRPAAGGRPHYQYLIRFRDLDVHYDRWLTTKQLHESYPADAKRLIEAYRPTA